MRSMLRVAALAATLIATAAVPAGAVVGGSATDLPFAARLTYGPPGVEGSTGCSGALITPRYVLSGKSCFPGTTAGRPAKDLTVTVAGATLPAVEVLPHESRDVALVRLAADLPASVAPVALAAAPPAAGDAILVAGFGRTATEWRPDRVHAATAVVDEVGTTTLSVSGPDGVTTCLGDAGGPAYVLAGGVPRLLGVHGASFQGGCHGAAGTDTRATEVRVDDLQPWVDQQLRLRTSWEVFRNTATNQCVAVDAERNRVGNRLEQAVCNDAADQGWKATSAGGNAVILTNYFGKYCAGVGTSTAYNAPVSLQACAGAGQQWTPEVMSDGAVRFRNKATNSCLAVPASNTTAGTLLINWTCDAAVRRDQHWKVQPRDTGRVLRNQVTKGCVRSRDAVAGYVLDQGNCIDVSTVRFAFPSDATTATPIVNLATNRCLSVNNSTTSNTQLIQVSCTGAADQQWTLTKGTVSGTPVIRFRNQFSGQCIGVAAANPAVGARVIQWPCGSADHWFEY